MDAIVIEYAIDTVYLNFDSGFECIESLSHNRLADIWAHSNYYDSDEDLTSRYQELLNIIPSDDAIKDNIHDSLSFLKEIIENNLETKVAKYVGSRTNMLIVCVRDIPMSEWIEVQHFVLLKEADEVLKSVGFL